MSIIIIHLLLYGKWFMWHGGYAWGPRFMIPTLPFWAMFLAPVVSIADFRFWIFDGHSKTQSLSSSRSPSTEVKRPKSKILGVAFILLAILSLIPQLLSVAIDFTPFQDSLLETGLPLFARQTFFDPQYAALIGAWPYVTLNTLDLVWISRGQVNWWLGAILVANIIITGVYLKRKSTNDFLKSPEHPKFRYFDLLPY
ncbi:MAG: hypothetical protein GY797_38555, partial [Deltaproteobacteria bacterium]|nr:hypothetical protein [Deltaproteobacteria bacterium]